LVTRYRRDAGRGSGSNGSGPCTPPWTCGAPPPTAPKKPNRPQRIQQAQVDWESESFGVTPAFSGRINQGNKLALYFNMPNPGDASIGLTISEALGAALDASEDLADTLMHSAANTFTPNTIGALTRKDHPLSPTPEPYNYIPGWKMFFASDSPHYQRATQLATRTTPVANGAIFTFGTPDTYPTILNQW